MVEEQLLPSIGKTAHDLIRKINRTLSTRPMNDRPFRTRHPHQVVSCIVNRHARSAYFSFLLISFAK